ncbi:cell division protein FtsI (penicillin-binding protein 3) [Sphingomonas sp. BE270]|jgi:cell division protein FtsI (penicillin-binding protein 3)|nr:MULTISPECIES: penicillin-binding protein 2 [unclassified Sphingomonas]MDR6847358.1 cell division protein FtsI (penicillin-binding protein 3) [Sphingomonas sp. BE137]MDR7256902.1 cell division protein FtsI (penicillin-binding protein 3) [Sphingomonas sp. BE270]
MSTLVARPLPARRSSDQRHALVAVAHVRLMMLMLLIGAGFLLVIVRIALLGLLGSPAGAATLTVNPVVRADILDRNGQPLARTIEAWTIGVRPAELLGDRQSLADRLAAAMPDHDSAWYLQRLTMKAKFTYLDKHASPAMVNEIHALGEPGIVFAREPERLYPQSTMAAHALGYIGPTATDPNIMGRAGIERAFDARLTDPRHRGEPIALSIDARVQTAMESELGRAMVTFQAKAATGLVLDVHTGEVIAMASLPVYNPNKLTGTTSDALRNNVTQSVYELGSTFKPITMATAIQSGTITSMARRFDATAPLKVGGFTIHDERGDPKRWLNIPETLIYSSNVATARIADELGKDKLSAMFTGMGFGERPSIELRERAGPIWPRYWGRTTVMTTAYGHGIAVTPLHLANAYATMVNGGIWRPTTLLKVAPGQAPAGRRVLSEQTSARMRQLLRLVCLYGTGRKGDAPGYRVGGKTGTAEAASNGGYDHHRNVATFVAAFPMDAPRYVVLAMLDSPEGTRETGGWKTAAWNAAPVVGRVIARTGSILGVMPDARRDVDISDLRPMLTLVAGATPPSGAEEQ